MSNIMSNAMKSESRIEGQWFLEFWIDSCDIIIGCRGWSVVR